MAEGLFFNLNFGADNAKLKDFVKSIGDLNAKSVLAGFGMAGLYEVTSKILDQADKNALSLNNFAGMTGQSTQQMQKFDTAAQEAGISAGVVASSIDRLTLSAAQMLKTGAGSNWWNIIGVDYTQINKAKLLFDVLTRVKSMYKDVGTQRWMLKNLGIDDSLVLLDVNKGFADFQKNISNTNEELAQMKEYHSAMVQLGQEWNIIMTTTGANLSTVVLPALRALADYMKEIAPYAQNKTLKDYINLPGDFVVSQVERTQREYADKSMYNRNLEKSVGNPSVRNFYVTQHITTDKAKDAADESVKGIKLAAGQSNDRGN